MKKIRWKRYEYKHFTLLKVVQEEEKVKWNLKNDGRQNNLEFLMMKEKMQDFRI